MAQITEKELSALSDLLGMEENLEAKYRFYAQNTNDSVLKNQYEQTAQAHRHHYEALYACLK